jgi:hypothetical protein
MAVLVPTALFPHPVRQHTTASSNDFTAKFLKFGAVIFFIRGEICDARICHGYFAVINLAASKKAAQLPAPQRIRQACKT